MDVDGDKKTEIVTKWVSGGSGVDGLISIIKYDKNKFKEYRFANIGDLPIENNIKDLNKDGKYEILDCLLA